MSFMHLILLFLLFMVRAETDDDEDIWDCTSFPCRGNGCTGRITPNEFKVPEGGELEMTCELLNYDGLLDSSHLLFRGPDGLISMDHISWNDNRSIVMKLSDVRSIGNDDYSCLLNETETNPENPCYFVDLKVVDVGKPPEKVTEVECVSKEYKSMDCSACPDEVPEHLTKVTEFSWTVNYFSNISEAYFCLYFVDKCSDCNCTCHICGEDSESKYRACMDEKQFMPIRSLYTFTIVAANDFGNTRSTIEKEIGFNIVEPYEVQNLTAEVDVYNMTVRWFPPHGLEMMSDFLMYKLKYTSKWNMASEVIYVHVDEGNSMDKQVFQELTSLKPHTHYDITVEAKPTNGTYWGDTAQIWEKTRESVPTAGPHIPTGGFWIKYPHLPCSDKWCRKVVIFWRLIPEDQQNGVLQSHTIASLSDTNQSETVEVSGNCKYAELDLSKEHSYFVTIWASTEVGSSPSDTIFIPKSSDLLEAPMASAELGQNKTSVIIWLRTNEGVSCDRYVLLYCLVHNGECLDDIVEEPLDSATASFEINFGMSLDEQGKFSLLYGVSCLQDDMTSGLSGMDECIYGHDAKPEKVEYEVYSRNYNSLELEVVKNSCHGISEFGMPLFYVVQYCRAELDEDVCVPQSELHEMNVSIWTEIITLKNLLSGTKYLVGLCAVSNAGEGEVFSSSIVTAITSDAVPVFVWVLVGFAAVIIAVAVVVGYRFLSDKCYQMKTMDIQFPEENDINNGEVDGFHNTGYISDYSEKAQGSMYNYRGTDVSCISTKIAELIPEDNASIEGYNLSLEQAGSETNDNLSERVMYEACRNEIQSSPDEKVVCANIHGETQAEICENGNIQDDHSLYSQCIFDIGENSEVPTGETDTQKRSCRMQNDSGVSVAQCAASESSASSRPGDDIASLSNFDVGDSIDSDYNSSFYHEQDTGGGNKVAKCSDTELSVTINGSSEENIAFNDSGNCNQNANEIEDYVQVSNNDAFSSVKCSQISDYVHVAQNQIPQVDLNIGTQEYEKDYIHISGINLEESFDTNYFETPQISVLPNTENCCADINAKLSDTKNTAVQGYVTVDLIPI